MDLHTKRTAYTSDICRYRSEFQRPTWCFYGNSKPSYSRFSFEFHQFILSLVTKIRHVSVIVQTCLVYDYKSQSAGLTVTICPIQRKPNQMYLLFDRYHLSFLETHFPPPRRVTLDFKEIALPIARVAFVLKCHQIINSN